MQVKRAALAYPNLRKVVIEAEEDFKGDFESIRKYRNHSLHQANTELVREVN